jgi:DNA adenine methylase
MKTPIRWYGGKQRMLKYILPLVPEHTTYTESFFGGGALYFTKEPVQVEVINDISKEAINFYSVTVKDFDKLQTEISSTLHSHSAFDDAKVVYAYPHLFDDIKRAWAFFTLSSQSFASNMSSYGFEVTGGRNFTSGIDRKRTGFTDEFKKRLANTNIECDDALKVITRYDCDTTFHYVDPPYFNSDCCAYKGYTEADFKNLLETLSKVKGKFLLSSYPSEILTEYTTANGWHTTSVNKNVSVNNRRGAKYKAKTEVLTANYPIL